MPLVIAGHQRSGTTMLMKLCNAHPEIALGSELGCFLNMGELRATYALRMLRRWLVVTAFKRDPIVRIGEETPPEQGFPRWELGIALRNFASGIRFTASAVRNSRERIDAGSIEAALRSILPGRRIVGDKYPDYTYELDRLTVTGGPTVVAIYRDCRDVAVSTLHLARGRWRHRRFSRLMDTPEKVACRWVRSIEAIEKHAESVHAIRYEDFVRNPEEGVAALAAWLDVDPGGFETSSVATDRVGRHKAGLSAEETAALMEIAGPHMQRLGYL